MYFLCLCSWRMVVRQPKVALLLETRFCPLTASPRRAWTTWRPRTRSRATLATSAWLCWSKPWHRALPPTPTHASLRTGFSREQEDICLHDSRGSRRSLPHTLTQAFRFEAVLHFDHRDCTSMQMFTAVVVGAWSSSHTVTQLVLPDLLEDTRSISRSNTLLVCVFVFALLGLLVWVCFSVSIMLMVLKVFHFIHACFLLWTVVCVVCVCLSPWLVFLSWRLTEHVQFCIWTVTDGLH